jgi:hypothetical protein
LPAYPFGIFWSWCCLYFFDWRLTPLLSFDHHVVCTSSIAGKQTNKQTKKQTRG